MTTVETGHRLLHDRYEIQELIAVGGMGEVWRARDIILDRPVAVKLLRGECAGDPVFIARFRSEARHAAALSHPNIAAVLDYGETTSADIGEQLAYLVMELVEGAPLSARLAAEGPLDTGTTLTVLRQAAAGLAEAHRAGVVHRDVKPANILVRPDGTVKLTDFGISWSAASVPITRTGQVIGTAQYMSPEQAMGERVSPASDVYALGMVGYESLTGHTPFEGDNPVTIALKQVRERPEPLPAELPPDVRALIDAALVKDPEVRLPDGAAFLAAVEETLDKPSAAPSTRTRPVPAAAAPRHGARPAASPPPERRFPRALLVALPLLLFVGLGGGAVALLGDSPPADPPGPAGAVSSGTASGIELAEADYLGRPVQDVVADLTALGLTVRQVEDGTTASAPGTVTRLAPAGVLLEPGDEVLLHVAVPSAEVAPDADTPAGDVAPAPVVVPEPPRAPADDRVTVDAPPAGSPAPAPPAGSPAPAPPAGSPAPAPPAEDGDTATPTTPAEGGDTATPTTPAEGGSTATPTTPAEGGSTATPTTPAEDGSTATPTTPAEDGDTATPTTPAEDGGSTATPTSPAGDDGAEETTQAAETGPAEETPAAAA